MDFGAYGPFATIAAMAAALVALFSLLLLKAVGPVGRWTEQTGSTPSFFVTFAIRSISIGLIAVTYFTLNQTNYRFFGGMAVVFGLIAARLIARLDFLLKLHTIKVPLLARDGSQARSAKGRPLSNTLIVGTEDELRDGVKRALAAARKKQGGGLSLAQLMSGFGAGNVNDPAALWPEPVLARIGNRLVLVLTGALLSAVMALYLAAASLDMHIRSTERAAPTPAAAQG